MSRVWKTGDIALAAYVDMVSELSREREKGNGVRLVKVHPNGYGSIYVFKDEHDVIDDIIVGFTASESFRFDSKVRVLKSIGYSNKPEDKKRSNGGRHGHKR